MRAAEPATAAGVLEGPHAELALDHLRRIFPTDTVGRLELADAGPAHTLVSLAGVQVERTIDRHPAGLPGRHHGRLGASPRSNPLCSVRIC